MMPAAVNRTVFPVPNNSAGGPEILKFRVVKRILLVTHKFVEAVIYL
jgi:hypothetical protein